MTKLREAMPETAMRIDRMRTEIGVAAVNEILRNAMLGLPGYFFAMENHRTFGEPDTTLTSVMCWDESDKSYRVDPQWMIDATEFAASIGIEVDTVDETDHEEARARAVTLRNILAKAKYA